MPSANAGVKLQAPVLLLVETVVTGAPNIKVGEHGQTVIVALSGSVLFDGHADQKVLRELKPSKIRGVPSDAMVCSAYELGISEEHEGIIILDEDAPPGTPLADVMGDAECLKYISWDGNEMPIVRFAEDRQGRPSFSVV